MIGSGTLAAVVVLTLAAAASGDPTGPPVSTATPTASGSPGVGKTIRTTSGSWSTTAGFSYQWLRCVKGYRACANLPGSPTYAVIPGATVATYTPVPADVGHILMARVTATNAAGSASVLSSGLGPVEAKPPGVEHRPWIAGSKRVGQRLYERDDHWTRFPYVFRLQWLRCSAQGNACVRITGVRKQCANGTCIRVRIGVQPDYRLTRKDVGRRLRVRVTAWNGAGRAACTSSPTRIIGGPRG